MRKIICFLIVSVTLFSAQPIFAHTFNDIIYLIFNGKDSPRVKKIKEEAAKEEAARKAAAEYKAIEQKKIDVTHKTGK